MSGSDDRQDATDSSVRKLAQQSIDRLIDGQGGPGDGADGLPVEADLEAAFLLLADSLAAARLGEGAAEADDPVKLGRFLILEELGRGGFGIVLRAFDPDLERTVALKIPRPEKLLSGSAPNDFVREAQIVATLEHPGIVRVYESQRIGPIWYIASQFCEGPTLGEWINESPGRVTPSVAAHLARQIAAAVHHAHQRGVLHLDLKPENILLELTDTADGFPKALVTDFGLSGRIETPSPGRVVGTPAYMAPEQQRGDASQIGVATDVFGIGGILAASLGRKVHTAGSPGAAREQAGEAARQASYLTPTPRDLAAIIDKCLAEHPSDRYSSAQSLGDDLSRFLRGDPVRARPIGIAARCWRASKNRPVTALSFALLVAAVGVGLAASTRAREEAGRFFLRWHDEQQAHAVTGKQLQKVMQDMTVEVLGSIAQDRRFAYNNYGHLDLFASSPSKKAVRHEGTGASPVCEAAWRAMSISLAMADGERQWTAAASSKLLGDGIEAWNKVIAIAPDDEGWQRCLVLHLLIYASRHGDGDWLAWRNNPQGVAKIDPTVLAAIEQQYADTLLEAVERWHSWQSLRISRGMLEAVVSLKDLEGDEDLHDEETRRAVRARRLLARLHHARDASAAGAATLQVVLAMAQRAPTADKCDPEVAAEIAEVLKVGSESFRHTDRKRQIKMLRAAMVYAERAWRDSAEIEHVLRLSGLYRHLAVVESKGGEFGEARRSLLTAIGIVQRDPSALPTDRRLLRRLTHLNRRMVVVADQLGNAEESVDSLRLAVRAFKAMNLTADNDRSDWMAACDLSLELANRLQSTGETKEADRVRHAHESFVSALPPRYSQHIAFSRFTSARDESATQ
jgi:hypothetical protein